MEKPLVSIAVLTYNHAKYIEQAIEGFLIQKTNFKIEIVIHDDASKDNTASILQHYSEKHPSLFKNTYHETNIGMIPNFINTLNACKGKYIAFCEGDDYWTDPLKLQKQVDFLEQNPDYAICFHNVMVYNESSKSLQEDDITTLKEKSTFTKLDLAEGNFLHTPSVVLKNDFTLHSWFKRLPIGDWPLYLVQLKDRKIKRLDDKMAVYRVHEQSSWSSKSNYFRLKRSIKTINLILKNIPFSDSEKQILLKQKQEWTNEYKTIKGSLYKQLKRFLRGQTNS